MADKNSVQCLLLNRLIIKSMKKLFTLLVIFGTSLMPLSASLAQTPQNVDMWGAASQLATLENARTTESIYGDFEIEEGGQRKLLILLLSAGHS